MKERAEQFLRNRGFISHKVTVYNEKLDRLQEIKTEDLMVEFTEIEQSNEWVSVEDRLPKTQGHYLVRVKNSFPKNCDCVVCEFYEDNKTFYTEYDEPVGDALEWKKID
jgi:hypothetical protein